VSGDLRISLLGGFRAEVGGLPVAEEAWRRSGARDLVKLLALRPGHRLHREELTDTLWPELDPSAGAGRLNKALHFARRALTADHVRLRGELLSLEGEPLWVDVDAFDAAVRRGDTEEALTLYTGDLLPENRFDLWVEAPRAQLRARVASLLLDQAADREANGDVRGAVSSLERLVGIDPLHEAAHARLMRLTAEAGDRHLALRWYGRLVEGLREELGVDPSDELRRLHGDIAAGRLGPRVDSAWETADREPPLAAPPEAPSPIDEERKLVTVLAADLRGIQGPAEAADPEHSRRTIGTWTDLMCEVLGKWRGTVERLVGGGAVAIFGYPAACEDHAARALCAGFEILQSVPVSVRIGIDTGEIIAPTARGTPLSDVGGDVLDVAARLREAAAPRTLLAAERTRRAAHVGDFHFGEALQLGGSGARPLVGRRLLAASWAAEWRLPEFEPPMVGREDESRAVLSLVDESAASGLPRLITVVGVAGVGKSRLVREVVSAALQGEPDTRVLRGRCLATGDGITYWALGEVLRDACGIALGEAGEVAHDKLRVRLRELLSLSGLDESEVDDTIYALAATAAIQLPGSPLDGADPRTVADELAGAWPRFATALASLGPVLIVVEDLHWAGLPLLDMLARLVARSEGPVVLLTTARPEFLERHPGFGAGSADVSMITLRSLTESAGRELLDRLPHGQDLPVRRREEILARAEGNPYFLDQLVAHVTDGEVGALPDSVHALLAARVDGLPAPEKRLLQAAAVVGRIFWIEALRGLTGEDDLDDALRALENRGLVLARHTSSLAGQAEFAFKHALLRDVAYASLPAAPRVRGHAHTAAWLEEVSGDRAGELIELIAYHYADAADSVELDLAWPGEPQRKEWVRAKAFRSLIEAGTAARRRYAIPKALDLHQHALRLAEGVRERAEAAEAIGDDHEAAFLGDAAIPAWEEALAELRREPGHEDWRARLCLKTAVMAVNRWGGFRVPPDPALGDRLIDEGLAVVGDPSARTQLLALRALCGSRWAWTGRPDPVPAAERRRAAESARRLAHELGSPPLQGLALLGLAAAHFIDGAYDQAVAAILEEVHLMDQGGRDRDRALGHTIACLVVGDVAGAHDRALAHARMSYALGQAISPHDRLHGTFMMMACLGHLGRWSEMAPFLDEHLAFLQGPEAHMSCPYLRGGPLLGAIGLCHLGEVHRAREVADLVTPDPDHPGYVEALHGRLAIELGDPETGRALAERLVLMGRRPGPVEIPFESIVLVEAMEAQGDWDALERFLPAARSRGAYLAAMSPTCDRAEGLARAAAGSPGDAAVLLRRAVDGFDRLSLPLQAARAREQLACVVRDRDLLRSALDAFERLGAVRDAARAREALGAR
jgi:DNA-binding SARP family transcriptional activator